MLDKGQKRPGKGRPKGSTNTRLEFTPSQEAAVYAAVLARRYRLKGYKNHVPGAQGRLVPIHSECARQALAALGRGADERQIATVARHLAKGHHRRAVGTRMLNRITAEVGGKLSESEKLHLLTFLTKELIALGTLSDSDMRHLIRSLSKHLIGDPI